jgi:hypothetical protein
MNIKPELPRPGLFRDRRDSRDWIKREKRANRWPRGSCAPPMTSICSTRKSRGIRRQSLAEFHKIVALELVARPCPSFALATSRQQVSHLIIPGAIGMNGARPHCLSNYRDD